MTHSEIDEDGVRHTVSPEYLAARERDEAEQAEMLLGMVDRFSSKMLATLEELQRALKAFGVVVDESELTKCYEGCKDSFDDCFDVVRTGLKEKL